MTVLGALCPECGKQIRVYVQEFGYPVVKRATLSWHCGSCNGRQDRDLSGTEELSAVLNSIMEQGKVIEALKEAELRDKVKVMVGGGAITAEFAEQIGADGYRATAPEAVELAMSLLGK